MALKLNGQRQERNVKLTHEPTGVTVWFRRLGFIELTRIAGNHSGRPGDLVAALQEPGVGVTQWDGVTGPNDMSVAYSPGALEAVCDQVPEFGGWFNDNLLKIAGFRADGAIEGDVGDDEGKSEPPANG